jgi:predicted metal-dependent HD superfamily phosphohydrolase
MTSKKITSPSFPLSKALWKSAKPIYASVERTYHNIEYIEQGWERLADIYVKPTLPQEMAWIAHKVVYDPSLDDCEKKSADWIDMALKGMRLEIGEKSAVREAKLIVESLEGYSPKTPAAIPVVDVSLQRLASDWNNFIEYAWRLRAESKHLTEKEWVDISKKFFKSLLDKEQIFTTPEAKRRWERRLRDNLSQSILHHPFEQTRLFTDEQSSTSIKRHP